MILKSTKKFFFVALLTVVSGAVFVLPTFALDPNELTPNLSVSIGNSDSSVIFEGISCDSLDCEIGWIGQYVGALYRYGVGLAAVLAVVMIMAGGMMWLASGGSPDRVSMAKSFVTASLTGLVIALFSFTILYTVNPALVSLEPLRIQRVENIDLSRPEFDSFAGTVACQTSEQNISFENIGSQANQPTIDVSDYAPSRLSPLAVPTDCSRYNFEGYGVDSRVLRAIAAAESNCNPSATSGAGACGMMQMLPSTAGKTCDYLIDHPQESIELAASYIRANERTHNNNVSHIFAGYNGGYATTSRGGRLGPLAQSRDCEGMLAYECCINPGGLEETQGYVIRATRYYQSQ